MVGIFKETASGSKNDRTERKKVLSLAQSRQIDAVLVSELSRWGRSLLDLIETLQALQSWKVSMLAVSGLQLDLSTPMPSCLPACWPAWRSLSVTYCGNG